MTPEQEKQEKTVKQEKQARPEKQEKPKADKRSKPAEDQPGKKEAKQAEKKPKEPHKVPRLLTKYKQVIGPALREKLGVRNIMQVPRLTKIVVNMGVGEAIQEAKVLDDAVADMRNITGQQPVITRSRKAISNFKLKKGQSVGCKVTLRGYRMFEFFDRLVSIALPRVRDFRGLLRRSFDGRGNYSIGIKEQIVFHEVDSDKISKILGMDITVCTNAGSDEHAQVFLEAMGMPFRKA